MLSRDGVIARFIFAFCFFFLPGSEMITGWPATISGLLGSIELATGLMRYSPLIELFGHRKDKSNAKDIGVIPLNKPRNNDEASRH